MPRCHPSGLRQGKHVSEAQAVLETLLCPVVLLGWNHKPPSEQHRCAALGFFQKFFFPFFVFFSCCLKEGKQNGPLRGVEV